MPRKPKSIWWKSAPLAKPPVCKLMDYGSFKYPRAKKAHEAKAQAEADTSKR